MGLEELVLGPGGPKVRLAWHRDCGGGRGGFMLPCGGGGGRLRALDWTLISVADVDGPNMATWRYADFGSAVPCSPVRAAA